MDNKKALFLVSFFTVLSALNLFSVKAYALPNFSNMDYSEKVLTVSRTYEENEKKLVSLKSEIKNLEIQLEEKNKEMIDLQKDKQAQKAVISNQSNNNDLKLLDMVLSSNSMSEFMTNVKVSKTVMVIKSKTMQTLNNKEEIILEQHEKLNNDYEILKKEREDISKEQEELKKIEKEINGLTEIRNGNIIYNPNNLLQKSNITVEQLEEKLKGTGLSGLAPAYVQAEQIYGVNAIFLVSLSAHESAWGTSRRAIEDNNLTGFGVYSDSSVGINSHTKEENILGTAKWLKNKYLTPGASFYNGISIHAVNMRYCIGYDGLSNFSWSENITSIATSLIK